MPIITRSEAQSGQSLDCVTTPGNDSINCSWRLNGSRRGKALVTDSAKLGSLSISESTANNIHQVAGFRVSECSSTRCLAFPKIITEKCLCLTTLIKNSI